MITATKTKAKLQFLEERIKILGDEIDNLESKLKYATSKSQTAVKLIYMARTIITRYESKYTPDLYLCDCNSKNRKSVQGFFERVLKFYDDFPE